MKLINPLLKLLRHNGRLKKEKIKLQLRLSPSKVQCIYCFKMYWCSEVHLLFPFSSARFMLNLQLPKWPKFFMIWDKFQTRWMFRRWRPRSRCFLFFWAQSSSCILMYSTEGAISPLYLPFDHYLSNQVFLIAVGVILLLCGFVTAVIILVIRRRRKRQR